jgi:hypothetical protein
MAAAEGLAVAPLANGFAACADPDRLQEICDQLGPTHLRMFFQRWISRLPLPLNDTDRAAGYWWQLSVRQLETFGTIVLDDPRRTRACFGGNRLQRPGRPGMQARPGQPARASGQIP